MNNFPYLFAGYAVIWIALFLYLLHLGRRSRDLEEEIRELKRRVGR
ncbi:MAG TPA: CcmD family protein [Candidatus Binatia bacterium]|jgi:CcmD family protein|nr:CcmD family protein [Candidatus Binatia bacterium]